jgi:hypothetical protein
VGALAVVDTVGDVAERDGTPAAWCHLERGGRKERRRDSVEERQTRENEPGLRGSGDGRFERSEWDDAKGVPSDAAGNPIACERADI